MDSPYKIELIIDELCKHETTKHEAKERLLILFGVVSSSDESKEALNEAVSAVYFNDNSDYLRALYGVIRNLTGVKYSSTGDIDKLFKELNPDD